ncbi:hypothetical protein [Leuconostoc citreum]|uniref:hypothetical protein n=1 Tax=Leuconostoc citreum TaxID=33964 RepID=UPI0032DF7673
MTEIARSVDTGLPTLAYDVWSFSIDEGHNTKYSGAKMFICLDDDNCGVQMTLVNWGNPTPKHAAHFKQSSNKDNPHKRNCRMEYGTLDEQNSLLSIATGLNEIEDQMTLQESIENTIALAQASRNEVTETFQETEMPKEKDESWQIEKVNAYDSTNNRLGLSKGKIQRLRAFYLWAIEHPDGVVTSMDWPAYDFENKERPRFIKSLRSEKPIPISNIITNLDQSVSIIANQVKVYVGKFKVTFQNGIYKLNALKNSSVEIDISDSQLKYIMNNSKLKNAANTQTTIEIVLCGHFFVNKQKRLQFLRRTKYSGDWITIV